MILTLTELDDIFVVGLSRGGKLLTLNPQPLTFNPIPNTNTNTKVTKWRVALHLNTALCALKLKKN